MADNRDLEPGCYGCIHSLVCEVYRDWHNLMMKQALIPADAETFGKMSELIASMCQHYKPMEE